MPGKLLSEADLESDTAMAKVEMPRKRNEKVRRGPRDLGQDRTRRGGRPLRGGARAGGAWRAARTRLVPRPA